MLFHPVSIHLVNFNTVYTQVHVRPNVSAHFELPHTRNKKKKGIKEDPAHTKKTPLKNTLNVFARRLHPGVFVPGS